MAASLRLALLSLLVSLVSLVAVPTQAQVGAVVDNCKGGGYCTQYSGYKWTCSIRNSNPTLPLSYPVLSASNFAPTYTESCISPLGTYLGYLSKNGGSSTFTFYNNLTNPGIPSFSVPATDYASATVSTSSTVSGLAVVCPTISYCSEGVQVIAKVSCHFYNANPQRAYNVQFTTINFDPLYVSGINPDGTLPSDQTYSSSNTFDFSFQQLIFPPGNTVISLQISAADFFP